MTIRLNFWTGTLVIYALLFWTGLTWTKATRRPANISATYTLQVKTMKMDTYSRLKDVEGSILRATFQRQHQVDLISISSLNPGERIEVESSVPIASEWIEADRLEFKLELVRPGRFFERVLARCAQISKGLSEYNRSYQCTLPGDQVPFLTYRLSKDGLKTTPIASN